MKNYIIIFILLITSSIVFGQDKKIDQLELLYSQHHYSMVYKKAERLLNNPDYDYSVMPKYYKALSILQLAQNNRNYKKAKYDLAIAIRLFRDVKESPKSKDIFSAHQDEMIALKSDLIAWAEDANLAGDKQKHTKITAFIEEFLKDFEGVPVQTIDKKEIKEKQDKTNLSELRTAIIKSAENLLGTPYAYGGTTPSGFDCSGYSGYVMNQNKIELPRRSEDQFLSSKKINKDDAQPGDLVFFANSGNVNHVGIIYAKDKDGIYMIHSSTSKGVVISEITKDSYWAKRIKGFGTFIEK